MVFINRSSLLLTLLISIIFFNCNDKDSKQVIARVGKSTLSSDFLKNSIPDEYSNKITRDQKVNYVKQWIDKELLYQEAIHQKIDKDPIIKERLEKMKKDLLTAELLNRLATDAQIDSITDSSISLYYQNNANQFIREKDLVKYIDITFDDSKTAWETYRSLNKNNFMSIAALNSREPFDSSNISYTPIETIIPEIKQIILNTSINGISIPTKIENSYHIISVFDKLAKGGTCTLLEVRPEIISQLQTLKQKELIEKFISNLRIKNRVDFNLNLISNSINETSNP